MPSECWDRRPQRRGRSQSIDCRQRGRGQRVPLHSCPRNPTLTRGCAPSTPRCCRRGACPRSLPRGPRPGSPQASLEQQRRRMRMMTRTRTRRQRYGRMTRVGERRLRSEPTGLPPDGLSQPLAAAWRWRRPPRRQSLLRAAGAKCLLRPRTRRTGTMCESRSKAYGAGTGRRSRQQRRLVRLTPPRPHRLRLQGAGACCPGQGGQTPGKTRPRPTGPGPRGGRADRGPAVMAPHRQTTAGLSRPQ